MSRNSLLAAALLAGIIPGTAFAACNPPSSPLGSPGCQPPLATPQASDLVLGWRPSLFPNSLGYYTIADLAAYFSTATGFVTGPISSTIGHVALFNNNTGTLLEDGGALAAIAFSGAITDATGILLPAHGGTGLASLTTHGIVLGEGTAALAVTAAMSAGQVLLGQGVSADPTPQSITGDLTLAANGAAVVVKINGVALGTTTATDAHLLVANGTQWQSVALSGDGTISDAGALAVTKTGGVAFGTAATADTGAFGHTLGFLDAAAVASAQQSLSITALSVVGSGPGVITPDGSNNDYSVTLVHAACPCTLANPSVAPVPGTHGVIYVKQSATGTDTISTWGSDYLAPGGTATITLSAGANAQDVLAYTVLDATHVLLTPTLNFSH